MASRVTSLDPRSFGNFTYTSNFVVSNPNSVYKASFNQLKDLLGMNHEGAMFTQPNNESIAGGANRIFLTSSVLYDTGSFTDSNSIGVFYIPAKCKYTHIQLGFDIYLDGAQEKRAFIVSSEGGTDASAIALGSPNHVTEGVSDMMMQGVGAPIPANSGDSYSVLLLSLGTDTMVSSRTQFGACNYWIRGLGRA